MHPLGTAATGGTASSCGSVVHGTAVGVLLWLRTGCSAAATAAGFVEVWSAMRLLMRRGWLSTTLPLFCR